MTPLAPEPFVIDLGMLDRADVAPDGPRLPVRLRRFLAAVTVAVLCLTPAGSGRARPAGIGEALWTGSVSLAKFTLGQDSLYAAEPDGTAVTSQDLTTGRLRWRFGIAGLPMSTTEVADGVVAVLTRPRGDQVGWPTSTVAFVRQATGERIAETSGSLDGPSVAGKPAVVFTYRPEDERAGCDDSRISCLVLSGWDPAAGAMVWQLRPDPGSIVLQSLTGDRVDGLVELAVDGTVRLRDLATGAAVASARLPVEVRRDGQFVWVRDTLLAAVRTERGVEVTGYRRPSFDPAWSVIVADHTEPDSQGRGYLYLAGCGPDVCLFLSGMNVRVIDLTTGRVGPAIPLDLIGRAGAGVLIATVLPDDMPTTGAKGAAYLVEPTGRILSRVPAAGIVNWADGGDRVLVTEEGADRTGFILVGARGDRRDLGSVTGTGLNCQARGHFLACAEPVGRLRVWRLPV